MEAISGRSSHGVRAFVRALWITAAVLAGLVIAALAVLAIFGDRWLNAYAQRSVAVLEDKLQRPVEVGEIDVAAFQGRITVQKVVLGPGRNEPEDAPALTFAHATLDVGMWRTLLSLGMRPYLETITLRDVQVNVVKLPDGSLNWEHISMGDESAQQPVSSEPDRRLRNATIGSFALTNGSVRFLESDAADRKEARISQIDIALHDAGVAAGGRVALKAALLAPERNLSLDANLGGARAGENVPQLEQLKLSLEPTELAPLAPFLAALGGASALDRGVLSADVEVMPQPKGETLAKGLFALQRALFPQGKPFDAEVRFDMGLRRGAADLLLRDGTLKIGPMELRAKAALAALDDAPEVRDLRVTSRSLSFAALRAIYPAFDELTAPARLDGDFSLEARGGGDTKSQSADIELLLTHASLSIPDTLNKPAGTPLVLRASLRTGDNRLAFTPVSLQIADFALVAKGAITNLDREAPYIDLQLTTPNPRVAGLLRLLPPVARAAGKDRELAGSLNVKGSLQGTTQRYDANAELALAGLDVNVPGARLAGSGQASLTLRAAGDDRSGKLRVDFTPLTALYANVVQKPAGTPLRIDANLQEEGGHGELKFATRLASLVMEGTAKLRGEVPNQSFTADVKIPSFAVRKVLRLVPGYDPAAVGDIQFSGDVHAEGVTGKPETVEVRVPSFTAKASGSDLKGSLELANTVSPRVKLKARSDYLDLADFLPPQSGDPQDAPKADDGSSALARMNGNIDVMIKRGRAAEVAFENLQAKLRIENGRAHAERLEVSAFKGQFNGTGSEFPLASKRGDYVLKGVVKNAEVAGVLQRFAEVDELLQGRLTANLDLRARELTPDALQQSLTGLIQGGIAEGGFLPLNGYAALTSQLGDVARLPGLAQALERAEDRVGGPDAKVWELRDLVGALRFDRGAAVLDEPLTANTPQGTLRLEGKLGLSSPSDLRGTFTLTPEALTALTGGEVKFDRAVPLPFQVKGSITRPALSFNELDRMVEPMVRSFAKQEGEKQLRRGAKEILDQTGLSDETKRAIEEKQSRKKLEEEAKRQLEKRLPF